MKIRNNIIMKKVSSLKPFERNNKKHPDSQIKLLVKNINEFGFNVPLLIDREDNIIAGHGRLLAGKSLKFDTLPCLICDDLNDAQIKALRIADNRIAELAETDWDNLASEFKELQELNYDVELTGYDIEDIPGLEPEIEEVPADDAKEIKTDIVIGDIFQLGKNRLMCGDSTDYLLIEKLFDGKTANCLITDPPYGVDYSNKNIMLNKIDNGNRKEKHIANDSIDNYRKWFATWLSNIKDKIDNTFHIFMSSQELHNLRGAIEDIGIKWSDYLVWVKNNHVLGRKDYNSKHEFIVYGWFGTHKFYGGHQTTIINFDKPLKSDLHPTMKPVGLISTLIKHVSQTNGIIVDLFGGSGSTLIAAEQTNRICYMMELDTQYCQVIINRWEKLTGKKATKINGN
ncbi:DNA methyltransferase [Clostridiaceae bacterium HSG29]|nr:DNA methyltransferase [Clostridiaceae bacterium HSG29]